MIEPGNYAKWQPKYIWPRTRIGRVVATDGPVIRLAVNGSTYELDTRTEIINPVNACAWCDRPVKLAQSIYCCPECATSARNRFVDDCVFAAIVDFKRQHGGLSPSAPCLEEKSGYARNTVLAALRRLAKANRVHFLYEGRHRQIGVVGERWTYADPNQDLAE